MTEQRLMAPQELPDDPELKLRPSHLDEFVGQEKVKIKLGLLMEAAKIRNESLDHVLLSGPPGLGKTTLSHIIAREMGSQIHIVTGPNLEKKGDLAAILSNLQPRDVLFVDEIHRLSTALEEVLYGAMEDFKLDIVVGQGVSARTVRIDLPAFTLVGATTRSGLLSNPLRDRFGVHLHLDFYPQGELQKIVLRSGHILGVEVESQAAFEIAARSRGTPRVANRLLKRVRDFEQVKSSHTSEKLTLDQASVEKGLELFEIDRVGLDPLDRKFLIALIQKFRGGPVGLESLAAALGEEPDTLEDVVEPFLIQEGFIQRTPRGRLAQVRAFEHLNLNPPSMQPSMI